MIRSAVPPLDQVVCRIGTTFAAHMAEKCDSDYRMESEANTFAVEILIPRQELVKDLRRKKGAEIDHIVDLAKRYNVSKEMMARRYIDFQEEPAAIIFSQKGRIIYPYKHQYFPGLEVWNNNPVPPGSLTAKYKGDEGSSSEWQEHAGDMWLSSGRGKTVCEQVLKQQNGFMMTLLTLGDDESDEEDSDRSWNRRS